MTRPKKFLFNINMLSLAFDIEKPTLRKMIGGILPVEKEGRALIYDIKDVAKIIETRESMMVEKYKNQQYKINNPEPEDEIIDDPEQMNPLQRINYYKAEDLRQSAQLKQYKNEVESGKLMVAQDVERTIADAFKKIALVMDTLPDLLERDGIIGSGDIEKVINVMDKSREQLAIDLSDIAPAVDEINSLQTWEL